MTMLLTKSGTCRVKTGEFVANEVRSKLSFDKSKITASFIKRNHLDITINDEIMACQEKLKKLRIMQKLG